MSPVESDGLAVAQTETQWDEQTDAFISAIDNANKAQKSYDISLRDLLANPNKYMEMDKLESKVEMIRKSVTKYFTEMSSNFEAEKKELDSLLEQCDSSYSDIDSAITSKAAAARVPYFKPYFVYSNPDNREEILIEKYSEELEFLVGKLSGVSHYVADLSGTYNGHRFGSWLFSGEKNYMLTVRAPESILMDMDRSQTLIDGMLDSILQGYNSGQRNARKS